MFDRLKNKGRKFEDVVEEISRLIAEDERIDAKVSKRESLLGQDGAMHEFDILYEYEHLGIQYKVAIECKNWNNAINKNQVTDFAYKLRSVGNINGIFLSTSNLQRGANLVASYEDIRFIQYDDFRKISLTGNEKYLIPSSKTIGDPFWMFMNLDDDNPRPDAFGDKNIYLFESKYYAEKVRISQDFMQDSNIKLVGVTQKHLLALINLKKRKRIEILLHSPELSLEKKQPHFTRLQVEHLNWFIH